MKAEKTVVANWGNFPKISAEMNYPENRDQLWNLVKNSERLIARGNGKCYGDAALSPRIVSTLALNRILDFDSGQGVITCEAGVLLADVLDRIVPAGWFFHVTPGIKNITVGGAIASDVHGKNHPAKGCFSNWLVSFELLRGDGSVVTCSHTENTELFWQTCGGMGWTGVILSAQFRLMPVSSTNMRQTAVRANDLEALFHAFGDHSDMPYAAGWVDCLAEGATFGRGVVYFAEHDEQNKPEAPLRFPQKHSRNVPFYAPSWMLNPWSIRLHNNMLFGKAKTGEQIVDMDRYFYPLDSIRNWNRLYGRRGFIQYQFCLPEAHAPEGILRVLQTIRKSRDLPFLTVLKRHGDRPPEAVHSFPIRGYSLALDFPRSRTLMALIPRLDDLVWQAGGRIYLTKDACSAPRMGRIDPATFGEAKFHSLLKERILANG